ncbi:unnamed protein product [Amoebophrya sp. A25]|nr:unnamed protein product [Amoebophrya sp. A25]|eukprot:GSA25T00011086001.1
MKVFSEAAGRVSRFYTRYPRFAPLLAGIHLYGATDIVANRIEHYLSEPKRLNPCRTLGVMSAAPICNGALIYAYRAADALFGSSVKRFWHDVVPKVLFMQLVWTPTSIALYVFWSTTFHLFYEIIWDRLYAMRMGMPSHGEQVSNSGMVVTSIISLSGNQESQHVMNIDALSSTCRAVAEQEKSQNQQGHEQEKTVDVSDARNRGSRIPVCLARVGESLTNMEVTDFEVVKLDCTIDNGIETDKGKQHQQKQDLAKNANTSCSGATWMTLRELERLKSEVARLHRTSLQRRANLVSEDQEEKPTGLSKFTTTSSNTAKDHTAATTVTVEQEHSPTSSRPTHDKLSSMYSVVPRLAMQRLEDTFAEIFLTSWFVWPVSDCLNFRVIQRHFSPHFRATWDAIVGLFWNTYQSYATFKTSSTSYYNDETSTGRFLRILPSGTGLDDNSTSCLESRKRR